MLQKLLASQHSLAKVGSRSLWWHSCSEQVAAIDFRISKWGGHMLGSAALLVMDLSSLTSESFPHVSAQGTFMQRTRFPLVKGPRNKNRHLGLPGESISWSQNWGLAFTAGLCMMPWDAAGFLKGLWAGQQGFCTFFAYSIPNCFPFICFINWAST